MITYAEALDRKLPVTYESTRRALLSAYRKALNAWRRVCKDEEFDPFEDDNNPLWLAMMRDHHRRWDEAARLENER